MPVPAMQIQGHRYGLLLVVERAPKPRGQTSAFWLCRCNCGRELVLSGTHAKLRKSCGCIYKKRAKEPSNLPLLPWSEERSGYLIDHFYDDSLNVVLDGLNRLAGPKLTRVAMEHHARKLGLRRVWDRADTPNQGVPLAEDVREAILLHKDGQSKEYIREEFGWSEQQYSYMRYWLRRETKAIESVSRRLKAIQESRA